MMNPDPISPEQKSNSPHSIHLTTDAVVKLKSMMAKEGKEGAGLRIGVIPGGCAGLSYDLRFQKTPYDNDIVFEQNGLQVFVNPDCLALIRGTEIHYIDTLKE